MTHQNACRHYDEQTMFSLKYMKQNITFSCIFLKKIMGVALENKLKSHSTAFSATKMELHFGFKKTNVNKLRPVVF